MNINKHGSFYMRNGWGTKIIQSVKSNAMIFSPRCEEEAVDTIGLGRVMIKALRYWAVVMGLCTEEKTTEGIKEIPSELFKLINQYDEYFQNNASLILCHRNLATDKEGATAWYWFFNEFNYNMFTKEMFIESFNAYLVVNGEKSRKEAIDKEFNCLKNTYYTDKKIDAKTAVEDYIYPFFYQLKLLSYDNTTKRFQKNSFNKANLPVEVLVYCIIMDNEELVKDNKQINVDKLVGEVNQIGKYLNLNFTDLIDLLIIAENRGLLSLTNNFGNRFIELKVQDPVAVLDGYFRTEGVL